jgi:hypothetical protein
MLRMSWLDDSDGVISNVLVSVVFLYDCVPSGVSWYHASDAYALSSLTADIVTSDSIRLRSALNSQNSRTPPPLTA